MLRTVRKLLRPRFGVPAHVVSRQPSIVLLASGSQQRWDSLRHKQLVSIEGQPLLLRTLRQLAERWDTTPTVVTHHEQIAETVGHQADILHLPEEERRWIAETALSSRAAWGDPTLLLAGDVYWTEDALDTACNLNSGGPVRYLVTNAPLGDDILGVWFRRRHRHKIATALQHAVRHAEQSYSGKLWQSYRSLCGFSLFRHQLEEVHCVRINDESTDFDTLSAYRSFIQRQQQNRAA